MRNQRAEEDSGNKHSLDISPRAPKHSMKSFDSTVKGKDRYPTRNIHLAFRHKSNGLS